MGHSPVGVRVPPSAPFISTSMDQMQTQKRIGIYAGSFDPISNGHLDIIGRAAKVVDTLVVAVANNTSKKALFTYEEKRQLLLETTAGIPNVEVELFEGLLVNHALKRGANLLVRGIRTVSDFEYEFKMALTNRQMEPQIETIFLMSDGAYAHLASSLIKEIASMGGSIAGMVPSCVERAILNKFA